MIVLHHHVMNQEDAFILSKGHSIGALYVTLWSLGILSDEDLDSFCCDGTSLPAHPPLNGLEKVLFATGSLGHGASFAAGLALSAKLRGQMRRIFCLTSDGEWQEGSCWEALIFSAHHNLDNLTIMVDANGLQGFGTTGEVASQSSSSLREKFQRFTAEVEEVDGHNPIALRSALTCRGNGAPRMIIMRTHKGYGLSFLQDRLESHYLPLTAEQYERALKDLGELQH
jgi:transketolase